MTVVEVKALLNETSTTYDAYWENLIPELESYAREYTNNEDLMFTTGVKLFIAKACNYLASGAATAISNGIEREQLGDYQVQYFGGMGENNKRQAYPADVLAYLEPYRRPRWA